MSLITDVPLLETAEVCDPASGQFYLAEDGYADGGEPYTDEELLVINAECMKTN